VNASVAAYWAAVDRELAAYPPAPELEPLPMRSLESAQVYAVRLTSIGPYRIFAYYSRPSGQGPFPGLLLTPRYGSVDHIPDYHDRERYAVLQVVHRGQRLADRPFAAAYPGLLTLGIESPETWVYRGIAADCLRAAEFLLSRPEVDLGRVGIQGDDLALLTAARRPGFTAVQAGELLLYRLLEACQRTSAYPVEEVSDYLRSRPDQRAALANTMTYFDPLHHVDTIRAATLLLAGDEDALGGSVWQGPLREALTGTNVEEYRLTHHGATDHNWADAWLARKLGVEPRAQFRELV
jgi:cephalosporin-C deacetylase